MRRVLDRALRNAKFNVRAEMDVAGAMDALMTQHFDAAVLDMLFVNSAGLSGLDLLRRIRTTPNLKHLPVIMLTGFALNREVVVEAESLGAELWSKPIGPRLLVERLHALTHASRSQVESR